MLIGKLQLDVQALLEQTAGLQQVAFHGGDSAQHVQRTGGGPALLSLAAGRLDLERKCPRERQVAVLERHIGQLEHVEDLCGSVAGSPIQPPGFRKQLACFVQLASTGRSVTEQVQ